MMQSSDPVLPVEALRAAFCGHVGQRPVVISSPTGSGKSTLVPRFCPGRVLVVEPRRVACRALAARVAALEGCALGEAVGYQVRDDAQRSGQTRILFVTPGIALRMADQFGDFGAIILDEFHERGLEVDLLFALLRRDHAERMVVMSATLQAERIAEALVGVHLEAKGRAFPIDIGYMPQQMLLPSRDGLEARVLDAVIAAQRHGGDMLVFLPGKSEISAARATLASRLPRLDVLELHGGLSLREQALALSPGTSPRVILATNVAETSLTVPGVRVVIDSGLVRRTRYHNGRGYLALVPIALDSASQRAGRAGRTGPGHCIRLWSESAKLEDVTLPEIHRESLSPMLLAAAACGARVDALPFLDAPKAHALSDARLDLRAIGAIDEEDRLTEAGKGLFRLPIDPALGRLLVQARGTDAIHDVVDLVAALAVGRPLFTRPPNGDMPDPLREDGCDASALIRAVRAGDPQEHPLALGALREARDNAKRLRTLLSVAAGPQDLRAIDRRRLALLAMSADPRSPHVVRSRKGKATFSNGGTEIELARDSCVGLAKMPEAVVVFDARGVVDHGRTRMFITCACPAPIELLAEAGLGRDHVASASAKGKRVVAVIERVYAKRVLSSREEEPVSEAAHRAILDLLIHKRLGKPMSEAISNVSTRISHHRLALQLRSRRPRPEADWDALGEAPESLEVFLAGRLRELGLTRGNDVWLLSGEDLMPPALPYDIQQILDERFPARLELGDASYDVEYDLGKGRVTLQLRRGKPSHPPKRQFLPAFTGLTIFAEAGGGLHQVK